MELTRNVRAKVNQFVGKNVLANATDLIEFTLQSSSPDAPFSYKDIENYRFAKCLICGEIVQVKDNTSECPHCSVMWVGRELEGFTAEVRQWLLVSESLAYSLKNLGEPVLHTLQGDYWGRTENSLFVCDDGVIIEICAKLGLI